MTPPANITTATSWKASGITSANGRIPEGIGVETKNATRTHPWTATIFPASTTWSSHSPAFELVLVRRETWPSAESRAKPSTSSAATRMPRHQTAGARIRTASAPAVTSADVTVTWFAVNRRA